MYRNELDAQADRLSPTSVAKGFKEFLERKGER